MLAAILKREYRVSGAVISVWSQANIRLSPEFKATNSLHSVREPALTESAWDAIGVASTCQRDLHVIMLAVCHAKAVAT